MDGTATIRTRRTGVTHPSAPGRAKVRRPASSAPGGVRWWLVRRARARLAGGHYDDPACLDAVVTRLLRSLGGHNARRSVQVGCSVAGPARRQDAA